MNFPLNLSADLPKRLAVLPLKDIVVFPNMTTPLFVSRKQSMAALEFSGKTGNYCLMITQRDPSTVENTAQSLYQVGTIARITQRDRYEKDSYKILTESICRVAIKNVKLDENHLMTAEFVLIESTSELKQHQVSSFKNALKTSIQDLLTSNEKRSNDQLLNGLMNVDDLNHLISIIVSHVPAKINVKQSILEMTRVEFQAEAVLGLIEYELDATETERRIRARVRAQMDKNQREYYLNEQIKAIYKELDELNGTNLSEIDQLKESILQAKMPAEIEEKALGEWKKLKSMPGSSSEGAVIRNYIDWLLKMPWNNRAQLINDLHFSQERLDKDHFGLEKVKERILDYIAVLANTPTIRPPIICFVGPPGIGKTTLARSIAEGVGREFIRISLGGVRDEAEIRGHRRTYIGAIPGRIVSALSKVKTKNPLILLDEIDKMGMDFKGDPASALLEVLDPEQNSAFNDHYLDVGFDLSEVMFITTANSYNIPGPLRDRMEIIPLSGYTELEKLDIAKRFLVPKQIKENGLEKAQLKIKDELILSIIGDYTKEAGVRNLERVMGTICRKTVKFLLQNPRRKSLSLTSELIHTFLGVQKFTHNQSEHKTEIGYVNGLAWTEVGGELLGIEVEIMPGKGNLICTGSLGDVMKESMRTAMTVVRVRAGMLGLPDDFHEKWDLHIHAPEGAMPKDGPSAGIAITTAIVSALTGNAIKADIAMTGEVTLRGKVLAIGGLKEKLLAAIRSGIKMVIIPEENRKDLFDLPKEVKEKLTISMVSNIDEVLSLSLIKAIDFKENSNKYIPGFQLTRSENATL